MNNRPIVATEFFAVTQTQLLTVDRAYSRFLGSLRRQDRSERTIKTYKQRLKSFLSTYGHVPLEQITADVIDDWLDQYVNQESRYADHPHRPTESGSLSSTTVGNRIQAITAFFNFCDNRFEGEVNWRKKPTSHLKRPKRSKKKIQYKRQLEVCTIEDFQAMVEACHSARDRAIMAFLGDTGVRAGELVSLQIDDIKFKKRTAYITGKTEDREVDFTKKTAKLLKRWLKHRPKVRSHNHVFTSLVDTGHTVRGEPLTEQGLYLLCKRLAKRSGVKENWNPQAIRVMVGLTWANAGISPERIRIKLGHEDIKTTLEWYNWQDFESVQKTTKKLSPLKGIANL